MEMQGTGQLAVTISTCGDLVQEGALEVVPQVVKEKAMRRSEGGIPSAAWPRAAWFVRGLGR